MLVVYPIIFTGFVVLWDFWTINSRTEKVTEEYGPHWTASVTWIRFNPGNGNNLWPFLGWRLREPLKGQQSLNLGHLACDRKRNAINCIEDPSTNPRRNRKWTLYNCFNGSDMARWFLSIDIVVHSIWISSVGSWRESYTVDGWIDTIYLHLFNQLIYVMYLISTTIHRDYR